MDILTFFRDVQTHRGLASPTLVGTAHYPRFCHRKGLYWGPSPGAVVATTCIFPQLSRGHRDL